MTATTDTDSQAFKLGKPVLVCRWRLSNRQVVAERRQLRALAAREINGERMGTGLVAWARQHIEWTLEKGALQQPDGVLMLVVDEAGQAAMSVGPYHPLRRITLSQLAERSRQAHKEAEQTGVSPETLWLAYDDVLYCDEEPGTTPSGITSLIEDLACTLGIRVERRPGLWEATARKLVRFEEAFLVSDEHGVVPASDYDGPCAQRFAASYQKLMESQRKR